VLRFDEFSDSWRLAGKQITPLEAVRERLARSLVLSWPSGPGAPRLEQLEALLQAHRGGPCTVLLRYRCPAGSGVLSLGADWKVRPAAALLEQLETLLGAGSVQLRYTVEAAVSEAVG